MPLDEISPNPKSCYNYLPKVRGFKMASINITSAVAHMDELRLWISNQCLDLLALDESRLDPTIPSSFISIQGFEPYRFDRNRNGGGVCIYLKEGISAKNRRDLSDSRIEAVCLEIMKPNSKSFAVLACYRPSDLNAPTYFEIFESILSKIDTEFKELYILGDLNCDLLANTLTTQVRHLRLITECFQLSQLITEPTRITKRSKTLIDVVLTNTQQQQQQHHFICSILR